MLLLYMTSTNTVVNSKGVHGFYFLKGLNKIGVSFFINSVFLGVGLAMDAFSVSMSNAIIENRMSRRRMCAVAGVYALFQAAMPLIGWITVSTLSKYLAFFETAVPYIALLLLCYIGGKMIYDGLKNQKTQKAAVILTAGVLLIQGIATSIDALSVGFTIAGYSFAAALLCAAIISAVTFTICLAGLFIGKKFGVMLSDKAYLAGGIILIAVGVEIFIKGAVK